MNVRKQNADITVDLFPVDVKLAAAVPVVLEILKLCVAYKLTAARAGVHITVIYFGFSYNTVLNGDAAELAGVLLIGNVVEVINDGTGRIYHKVGSFLLLLNKRCVFSGGDVSFT